MRGKGRGSGKPVRKRWRRVLVNLRKLRLRRTARAIYNIRERGGDRKRERDDDKSKLLKSLISALHFKKAIGCQL